MDQVLVSLDGQQVPLLIETGSLGLALKQMADTSENAAKAQEAAQEAEAARDDTVNGLLAKANKNGSDISSASDWRTALSLGNAAIANIGVTSGTVAAGDDARIVAVETKADDTFANVDPLTGRSALDTAQIPTAAKYTTAQAAANAAYAAVLPFLDAVDNTIALTCSDGRLDLMCRKIGGWPIGDQGRINITVPAGKYTFTAGQRVSFPFGQRIQIAGAAPTALTFSSLFGVVDNGTRDHDVSIVVASGAAVAVGDTIQITGVTGTGECGVLAGQWPVIAKPASSQITIKVRAKAAALAAMTVTGMTIVKMNTVLEFQGSSGITLHGTLGDGSSGAQPGGFRDIAIIGNNAGSFNGLVLEQGAVLVTQGRFGVSDFGGDNIYLIYNSIMYSVFCCSSNSGGNGVYVLAGGVFQGVSGAFTCNNTYGAYGAYGTTLTITNASVSGNLNGAGTQAGVVAGNTLQVHGNTSSGVYATAGFMDVQGSSILSTGGTYGVRSLKGGRVNAANVTSQGHTNDMYSDGGSVIENPGATATNLSPSQNTYGNGGAIILNSPTASPAGAFSSLRVTDADPILYLTDGANTATRISGDIGHLRAITQSVNRDFYIGYDSAGTPVDVWQFDVSALSMLWGTSSLSQTALTLTGNQVVGVRKTGWAADTGTAKRTANATYAGGTAEASYTQATIQALMNAVRDSAQTIKALKDDLISHGLIGA